jgi:CheY-like chemotaxis protein
MLFLAPDDAIDSAETPYRFPFLASLTLDESEDSTEENDPNGSDPKNTGPHSQGKGKENQPPAPQKLKETVLFVDDEFDMLELGKALLESRGYRVILASDGVEALEIYKERWKEIDLVILDLVMPRKHGGQTYLEMKEINPSLKAFFCTGYASDKIITSLLQEENLRALQKPFKPDVFLQTVQDVLLSQY